MSARTFCRTALCMSAGFTMRLCGEYIWEHNATDAGLCFLLTIVFVALALWDDLFPE